MFGLFVKKTQPEKPKVSQTVKYDFNNPLPLADYFKNETGISFEKQLPILKSKLSSFCRKQTIISFGDCLNQIRQDRSLRQALFNYLTTNETYFYREFTQIQSMVKEIQASKNNARILCLPCSSGEEPFSIAIALLEAGVRESQFEITGVDISTDALERAVQGKYKQRNVSKMPAQLVSKYFMQKPGGYYLKPAIGSLVDFHAYNLFSADINRIGKFDYILSRNMLIYFDHETRQKASRILESLRANPEQPILYGHADLY